MDIGSCYDDASLSPLYYAIDMAIKALEQDPILDEIRAEIEHMIPYSKEALSMKLGLLEIIDKYIGEGNSEG